MIWVRKGTLYICIIDDIFNTSGIFFSFTKSANTRTCITVSNQVKRTTRQILGIALLPKGTFA